MASLPQLVKATPQGGTIHKYHLTGGKTSFMRYLGCYLGTCKFCNDIEEASDFVSSIELSPKKLWANDFYKTTKTLMVWFEELLWVEVFLCKYNGFSKGLGAIFFELFKSIRRILF